SEDSTKLAVTQRRRGTSGVALAVLQESSANGRGGYAVPPTKVSVIGLDVEKPALFLYDRLELLKKQAAAKVSIPRSISGLEDDVVVVGNQEKGRPLGWEGAPRMLCFDGCDWEEIAQESVSEMQVEGSGSQHQRKPWSGRGRGGRYDQVAMGLAPTTMTEGGSRVEGCSRGQRGGCVAAAVATKDTAVAESVGCRRSVPTRKKGDLLSFDRGGLLFLVLVTGALQANHIGGVSLQRSIVWIPLERRMLDLLHSLHLDLEYRDIRSP
ncbi:hypothetical protein B296_00026602, partial [Ensete ventricosum]